MKKPPATSTSSDCFLAYPLRPGLVAYQCRVCGWCFALIEEPRWRLLNLLIRESHVNHCRLPKAA